MITLRGILVGDVLECWRHFVLACRVLSCKQITLEQVQLGDALLLHFCKRTERIFGKESVTPNMHMHCHLRACIMDYGPLHGFWLYAFERYNGILGAMPNNNRSIEIQLMTRFLRESQIITAPFPTEFASDFVPLFPKPMAGTSGSVADTLSVDNDRVLPAEDFTISLPAFEVLIPKHSCRRVLDGTQKHCLVELYTYLYSVSRSAIDISSVYMQYPSIFANGKQLGSHRSRTASSSIVIANWDNQLFGNCSSSASADRTTTRAARVNFFCKHVVTINGQSKANVLVSLSWFKYHPHNTTFGKPLTVWYSDIFEIGGICSLIPVQFIKCRTVALVDKLDGESVLFVCPCIDF